MNRRRRYIRARGTLRERCEPLRFLLFCMLVSQGGCQDSGLSVADIHERGFLRAGYSEEPPYAFGHLLNACSALAFRPEDGAFSASVDSALAMVLVSPRRREVLESVGFSEASADPAGRSEDQH